MSKLRIEAVYIDPEVYEPMQELFGLGGMLVDARITFENSLINWSPSDHMEGYAVNSVLDGAQQIWTQIYKIRQQLESRSNTTQQISSSLHKLTAALLDQAMELNRTIERLRTELLFPRAEMLDELSVIEYTNGAITAAAQKAIEGIDKVLAGPTEEQPQTDYWGEFTGKEKRMTTMRVYAEGVLRRKRAQEDSAVEDAKAALQAAGTPLLNLIEEAQAIYTHPAAHPAPIIQFVNDVYDFVQNKMQGYAKGDPITPAYLARVIPDANNAIEFIQAWQQNYPAGAEFIPAIQAYSDATDNLVAALESTTKAPEQPGQQPSNYFGDEFTGSKVRRSRRKMRIMAQQTSPLRQSSADIAQYLSELQELHQQWNGPTPGFAQTGLMQLGQKINKAQTYLRQFKFTDVKYDIGYEFSQQLNGLVGMLQTAVQYFSTPNAGNDPEGSFTEAENLLTQATQQLDELAIAHESHIAEAQQQPTQPAEQQQQTMDQGV